MVIKKIHILSLFLVLFLIIGCHNILDNNDGIKPDGETDIGMTEPTPNPEPGVEPEPTTEMEEYPEGDLGKPHDYFTTMLHDTSSSLKTSVSYPSSFNYLNNLKMDFSSIIL
jgi:hypothetical protein